MRAINCKRLILILTRRSVMLNNFLFRSLLAGGHTEVVNTLNFIDISSSFSLVVSGCRDGELRLWDLESTGKNCKSKEQRRTVKECLTCTAVSPLPLDGNE